MYIYIYIPAYINYNCVCVYRDKPFLLFFDIRQCASVVSISDLLAGDFDATALFTCPTQQVLYN